ncbi:MAG: hypothetical protein AAF357_18190 [Verrucomicrobiota bacterium]
MNKQKVVATFWLVVLFGSGLIVGMTLSPATANGRSEPVGELYSLALPEERWVQNHRSLIAELDLSEEQLSLIDPVYERSSERLREVRETMAGSIKEVVRENRRSLMDILAPEQIESFKAIQTGARADR